MPPKDRASILAEYGIDEADFDGEEGPPKLDVDLWEVLGVKPGTGADELKKVLLAEATKDGEHSKEQEKSITMSCAICCLSLVRFLTDHIEQLPLAVTARILDTYDMLMVLCPLLEIKPWQTDGADGEHRRFLQGHWSKVGDAEARKLSKAEAQCWLAVYNLVLTPSVRRRYARRRSLSPALSRALSRSLARSLSRALSLTTRPCSPTPLTDAPRHACHPHPARTMAQVPVQLVP